MVNTILNLSFFTNYAMEYHDFNVSVQNGIYVIQKDFMPLMKIIINNIPSNSIDPDIYKKAQDLHKKETLSYESNKSNCLDRLILQIASQYILFQTNIKQFHIDSSILNKEKVQKALDMQKDIFVEYIKNTTKIITQLSDNRKTNLFQFDYNSLFKEFSPTYDKVDYEDLIVMFTSYTQALFANLKNFIQNMTTYSQNLLNKISDENLKEHFQALQNTSEEKFYSLVMDRMVKSEDISRYMDILIEERDGKGRSLNDAHKEAITKTIGPKADQVYNEMNEILNNYKNQGLSLINTKKSS